ncbi:DUF1653 domain-containing protein [Ruminococcus sp. OF02-6]|nr:DUF1653 domain-containing protein [Ruminococcus sp. OF02-6]
MSVAGIYRHFKGNYYEVVGLAIDVDSKEEFVLYRQMYDVFGYWMRPKEMFFGERMTENGPVVRFARIGTSYEKILEKEDIFNISIGNSETQNRYKVITSYKKDDDIIFEVKVIE